MFSRLWRPSSALWRSFSEDPLKLKLTPHQYYVTQGKGIERPFTGEYWNNHDLGAYHCVVCNSQLFSSLHKFYPDTGFCAFHTFEPGAVAVAEGSGNREVKCAQCQSHLGHVFEEKRPPTNLHYQIKSASLNFVPKPWFKPPPSKNEKRRARAQEATLKEEKANIHADAAASDPATPPSPPSPGDPEPVQQKQ